MRSRAWIVFLVILAFLPSFAVYAGETEGGSGETVKNTPSVVDVALQKTASANREYNGMIAGKAVNGTNANDSDCWFANIGSGDIYAYLLIDLGAALPLEYIEIESRNVGENTSNGHRKNLDVYLAEREFPEAVLNDNENAHLGESEDYDCLVKIGAGSGEMIPPYDTKAGQTGCKTINIPSEYAGKCYRYILVRKSTKNEGASIGQLRAYVVRPALSNYSAEENKAVFSFQHELDMSSLINDAVITNEDGERITAQPEQTEEGTYVYTIPQGKSNMSYIFDFSAVSDNYGVKTGAEPVEIVIPGLKDWSVSEFGFRNSSGMDAEKFHSDEEISLFADFENKSAAEETAVWMIAVLFNRDGEMYQAEEKRFNLAPQRKEMLTLSVIPDLDCEYICGYLWNVNAVTEAYGHFIKITK